MDKPVETSGLTDAGAAERLYAAACAFAPRIMELAPRMRADRKLDDDLIEEMEQAGLFSVLVPKRWGGAGLGPHEACRIIEVIGAADCSTAWVSSFYMLHNWFLCKFPLETQQTLFKGRSSVRAPAVFGPPGRADVELRYPLVPAGRPVCHPADDASTTPGGVSKERATGHAQITSAGGSAPPWWP